MVNLDPGLLWLLSPLCSSLIRLFVLPSGQTKKKKKNTVPQNSPDSYGKIAGCVSVQVAPLNLILPFHYLDWATKDEQEEPTPRTHRHAQYFIGLCLTIIITALVRMTSPPVWVLPTLRDNSLSCLCVCNCALLCAWAFCVWWCKLSVPGLPLQTKTFVFIRWNIKGLALHLKNLSQTE